MDPETKTDGEIEPKSPQGDAPVPAALESAERRPSYDLHWILAGPHGIRAGWLILLFYFLYRLLLNVFGGVAFAIYPALASSDSPLVAVISELIQFSAMVCTGTLIMVIAHRKPGDYNLKDSGAALHFSGGFVVGFLALSGLIGGLAAGAWLHFGPKAITGSSILMYAAVWGAVFLLVGCVEEGIFRCFALATLVRAINFWWALACVGAICLYAHFVVPGESTLGVHVFAALGLVPCFLIHLKRSAASNFWQAAWATSTGFGFIHTFNSGENWIGIFAAAFIGFVFCVSVWVTGSAWWAIGCHAAWDWAETYFYGTADSGFVAPGHLLTTSPAGNAMWSGGTDGPEGSLLIIPIVLLMLACLLIIYRRPRPATIPESAPAARLAS